MNKLARVVALAMALPFVFSILPRTVSAGTFFDIETIRAGSATLKEKVRPTKNQRHAETVKVSRTLAAYKVANVNVSTQCFPKRLKAVLLQVRKRYGVAPVVSSGYRSSRHNNRIGGARRSYHVKCMAADIRVPGIGKYTLARYLKGVSGIGGVGTYGCNRVVHIDVGPKRVWHKRCRSPRRKA